MCEGACVCFLYLPLRGLWTSSQVRNCNFSHFLLINTGCFPVGLWWVTHWISEVRGLRQNEGTQQFQLNVFFVFVRCYSRTPSGRHPWWETSLALFLGHLFLKSFPSYFHTNEPVSMDHPSFKTTFGWFLGSFKKEKSSGGWGGWWWFYCTSYTSDG